MPSFFNNSFVTCTGHSFNESIEQVKTLFCKTPNIENFSTLNNQSLSADNSEENNGRATITSTNDNQNSADMLNYASSLIGTSLQTSYNFDEE